MSDFQKIGDSLMCIRLFTPSRQAGDQYSDLWLRRFGHGWEEISQGQWLAIKAELDKVPS